MAFHSWDISNTAFTQSNFNRHQHMEMIDNKALHYLRIIQQIFSIKYKWSYIVSINILLETLFHFSILILAVDNSEVTWLLLKTNMKSEKKKCFTKSTRGIKTRFWPRRRENALDLSIPNAQKNSSNVIGEVKSCLLGEMISSSTFWNSFCTYSFTLNVVLKSWVPENVNPIEFQWQMAIYNAFCVN